MSDLRKDTSDYFKAISQSFFFEDARFGLLLLLALLLYSPRHFLCGTLASLIGHLYAARYSTPRVLRHFGLITINGFFFGIAMASLFKDTPAFFTAFMLGAMVVPLATKAAFEVLQHWKLSPFVAPYIFLTWVIWLAGHGGALELQPEVWPEALRATGMIDPGAPFAYRLWVATMQSCGRLLFLPDATFGATLFVLVALFSPRRGLFFASGTVLATLLAYALSGGPLAWENGYFSYCAGLVGLGLASFPEKFGWRTILVFCCLSSALTLAAEQLLRTLELPALSLPYVATMWMALLSRVPRLNVSWQPRRETGRIMRDLP